MRRKRTGFTLIELVTVMIAATVLLVSLASTVILSTQLLESPAEDSRQWHDRDIADRLAADLRYAVTVDDALPAGFAITKPAAVSGQSEHVVYQADLDGLTRQIDGGPVIELEIDAPSHQFSVDGYSAPTYLASANVARVRSTSDAATEGDSSSLQLDLPPGCKDGDLLLCVVAARTPWFLITPSGWNRLTYRRSGDLLLSVMYTTYSEASAGSASFHVYPSSGMSAAIVAIENTDPSSPLQWYASSSGNASAWNPATHPTPLEPTNFQPHQLNVQVFAAVGDPWYDGSLGLSSFTDVVQRTAAGGSWFYANSVAIAVRSGPTPTLTTTPRVLHQTSGDWAQVGIQLGVAP